MQQIRAATDERTFYAHRSLHFEKLKGTREGCGQFLMFLELRNSVLIDLLPELFPSALCEDEGSKA